MVFTSIVISRPSHSLKAASQTCIATPSTRISTAKLKAVNGYTTVSLAALLDISVRLALRPHVSADFADDAALARLHEPDGQERERLRRRDAQLDDKAARLDALARVERGA